MHTVYTIIPNFLLVLRLGWMDVQFDLFMLAFVYLWFLMLVIFCVSVYVVLSVLGYGIRVIISW